MARTHGTAAHARDRLSLAFIAFDDADGVLIPSLKLPSDRRWSRSVIVVHDPAMPRMCLAKIHACWAASALSDRYAPSAGRGDRDS
jgi:hypothetical protein